MKQLAINPKEAGSIIKFGKLPIFTRSLAHWSDMDNVVQLKVEGRYYAVEYRHKPLQENTQLRELLNDLNRMGKVGVEIAPIESSTELPEDDEVARECKADVEEAKEEATPKTQYQIGRERFERLRQAEKSGELAKCRSRRDICRLLELEYSETRHTSGYNWVSNQIMKGYLGEKLIKYNKQNSGEYRYYLTGRSPRYSGNKKIKEKTAEKQVRGLTNELEKLGFTNLPGTVAQTPSTTDPARLLKPYDYIIYKLFLYGNGQVDMKKAVNFEDVREVFAQSSFMEGKSSNYAGRMANVMLVHLLRQEVLEKAQDGVRNKDNIFSLTITKGGQYARQVYTTVSNGRYEKATEG